MHKPARPLGPWLELQSERVQRVLGELPSWEPTLGGLEGKFRFASGAQALAFLRPLAALLDAHPEPPNRLVLTGPVLSLALGLGMDRGGVHAADLALAGRISALRNAVATSAAQRIVDPGKNRPAPVARAIREELAQLGVTVPATSMKDGSTP